MKIITQINICCKRLLGFSKNYNKRKSEIKSSFICLFIDWLLCLLFLGASAEDYFIYKFYELSWYSRKQFVTEVKSMFLIRKFNHNGKQGRNIVEDKSKFDVVFKNYIKRNAVFSNNLTMEQFEDFVKRNNQVIIKPINGFNGNGIFILNYMEGLERIKQVYDFFQDNECVIEEVLQQDGWLHELNPGTLNTMRINVINYNGEFEIQNAILRSGQGFTVTDNICAGGVVAAIDLNTGMIISKFCDLMNREVLEHPLTNTVILGRVIPNWEEVKRVAVEAAKMIPDVIYSSWDIAVIKKGEIAIVEGNSYGNFNIQQIISKKGVLNQYKKYL